MIYDNLGGLLVATVVVVVIVSVVSTAAAFADFCRSSWRWNGLINIRWKKLRIAFNGPPLLLFVVVAWAVWPDVSVTYASCVIWSVLPDTTTDVGWDGGDDDDVKTCLLLSKRLLVFSIK